MIPYPLRRVHIGTFTFPTILAATFVTAYHLRESNS